ncbi:MAG: hypothetical protein LBS93_07895 [Synergistaceae bacterium]|jgi:hypothetical protein|nr:hypothetical protein [Synergistaceae bacterium]
MANLDFRKKFQTVLILAFALCAAALALPGAAPAYYDKSDPYIAERFDDLLQRRELYGDGIFRLYEIGDLYSDVDGKYGLIKHTEAGITVEKFMPDHSWTYFFQIPEGENHYTKWSARLEVLSIEGAIWSGVAMQNDKTGVSFAVNGSGRGALRVFMTDVNSRNVDEFFIDPENRWTTRTPFVLGIDYDVATGTLTASMDDNPVKTVKLPYYGIPAIASITGFSMETVSLSMGGSVTYGEFTARGSR